MWLVDTVRVVGVAVAMIGAFVTAPSGFRELLNRGRPVRGFFARWIPTLREHAAIRTKTVVGVAIIAGGVVTVDGWASEPDATIERRIELLGEHIDFLQQQLNHHQTATGQRFDELRTELQAVTVELRSAVDELGRRLDLTRDEAEKVDADGLPLIAVGILLGGLPDHWVAQPAVASLLIVLAFGIVALLVLARRRRWDR